MHRPPYRAYDAEPEQNGTVIQKALRVAQPIFLVLAGLAIVLFLRNQWTVLQTYPWRVLPGMFASSILLLLLTWAVEVEIWRRILTRMGGYLPYIPAIRIWFLSAVLRYIPGNIWQPLSMTVYCTKYGIRPEVTVTSIFLYQVIILLAVAPFLALYMWFGLAGGYLAEYLSPLSSWVAVLLVLPVVLFIIRPNWLIGALNLLLTRIGRSPMDARLSSGSLLVLLVAAAVNWFMWGVTFAALTMSIVELNADNMPQLLFFLIISYPIAYAVGFISLITPSGFGVREGAFMLLLSPMMSGSVVAVAALAMRVLTAIGELVLALLSVPFERAPVKRGSADGNAAASSTIVAADTDARLPLP